MFKFQSFKALWIILSLGLVFPAFADGEKHENEKQDIAREAMLAGQVAPLSELLSVVEQDFQGDVLKVELENEDVEKWGGTGDGKMFIYEIKVLTREGTLVKLKYNAKSLKLLATNRYDGKHRGD